MRPPFRQIGSSTEFDQWHWSREELEAICAYFDLSATGTISELRQRIILEMDEPGSQATSAPDTTDDPPGFGAGTDES